MRQRALPIVPRAARLRPKQGQRIRMSYRTSSPRALANAHVGRGHECRQRYLCTLVAPSRRGRTCSYKVAWLPAFIPFGCQEATRNSRWRGALVCVATAPTGPWNRGQINDRLAAAKPRRRRNSQEGETRFVNVASRPTLCRNRQSRSSARVHPWRCTKRSVRRFVAPIAPLYLRGFGCTGRF